MRVTAKALGIFVGATCLTSWTLATPVPNPPTEAAPSITTTITVKPAAAAPALDDATTKLLNDLEAADAKLKSLAAQVMYVKRFPEIQGGGTHVWRGTLTYQDLGKRADGVTNKRAYAVKFDTTIIDDRKRDEQQHYIFDGSWLLTTLPVEKTYTRLELVGPGMNKDPLKIGDGPLPLPIGQRKDDILARFEASAPTVLEGIAETPELKPLRALLSNARQLKLTPRPNSEAARNFRILRLWYRTSDNLPIFAQAENLDDSTAEVTLVDIRVNPEIAKETFNTNAPVGFKGDDRPLKK